MQLRSPWLDFITRWTFTKRVVASFPRFLEWSKATAKGAMVAQVSEDGNIVRVLDDSEGKVINFVTSVTEFNGGHLPRQPLDQLRRKIISGAGDTAGARSSIFVDV
jgi:hypothetical protein